MNERIQRFAIVWVWKLHIDTGEHMPDVPPKYEEGEEIRCFKVEGKKRPAIVWDSNSSTARLIMLTTERTRSVIPLGDVLDNGKVSYFNPDPQERKRYPYRLVETECQPLSDRHKQVLFDELNKYSVGSK